MKWVRWSWFAALVCFFATFLSEANSSEATLSAQVRMRDGVELATDIYLPSHRARFPTLIYRTPYGKKNEAETYRYFRSAVLRGYAVVVQDVRGRYESRGEFVPYVHEGHDGYDTIEWAAKQSWSNGRVGTFGLSYPGAVQWLAAGEQPPSLRAIVPAMTFASARQFIYANGLFSLTWHDWIWQNIAPDARARSGASGPKTDEEAMATWPTVKERLRSHLPISTLPDYKNVAPFFYKWVKTPPEDPYWDWSEISALHPKVKAAVMNLSGWYDEDYGPQGAIRNFEGKQRLSSGNARNSLVMGPWIHGVAHTGEAFAGERKFAASAAINYDSLVLDWLDGHLKDGFTARAAPVRYYVMGLDKWREASHWPPPGLTPQNWYLSAKGSLARKRGKGPTISEYVSDPKNPVLDDQNTTYGGFDLSDLSERKDVLTFETKPFEKGLEVTGQLLGRLFVSTTAKDVDLWMRVLDVAPDGTAFNLGSPGAEAKRLSLRKGTRRFVRPGEIVPVDFTSAYTSNFFRPGHRMRVIVHSTYYPTFARNPQTGASEMTSTELASATVRVHHSSRYPSRLMLNVREATLP